MDVQTRSDYHKSLYAGCHYFPTVAEAYVAWQKDPHIWKISWDDSDGCYRFRPKKKGDAWYESSEKILCGMYENYKQAADDAFFWINQSVMPEDLDSLLFLKKTMSEDQWDQLYMSKCIITVLSDAEFQKKYC